MVKFALVQIRNCIRLFFGDFKALLLYNAVFIDYFRFLLFFSFFIPFCQISHAQNNLFKNNNTWYFGNKAGLNFNTTPPSVLYDGELNTQESCASVSDKNSGRLLFYTDGKTVWDSTHHPMPHGTGLFGRHDAEQVAIVPYPENTNKYFILTSTHWNGTFYSIVDVALNNGKGDVDTIHKNIMLIGGWNVGQVRASDRITFTKHANKIDYWVVTHLTFNDSFYVYKINKYGVQPPTGFKIGANETPTNPELAGVIKFNKTGNLLVNCQPYDGAPLSRLQGFNFNNVTGEIESVKFSIENIWFPYGVEFSPNNRFMYVSHPIVNTIDQYDLSQQDIPNSVIPIHTYNANYTRVGQLQIGPNNKIYVAQPYTYYIPYRYLGVINQPDNLGTACNFVQDAIDLYPNNSFLGLPSTDFESEEPPQDTCFGPNLITNGDFENGLNSWTTDYFQWDSILSQTGQHQACTYKIDTIAHAFFNGYLATVWCPVPDVSSAGKKLVTFDGCANGLSDSSKIIISQNIEVKKNTNYKFVIHALNNYCCGIIPQLKVSINNQTVYLKQLNYANCQWDSSCFVWNSSGNNNANIAIYNISTGLQGNDFALDDISIREIIPCSDFSSLCSHIDTFNCKTLTFLSDSSRFCIPVILTADSSSFANNGFHFCMSFDTNFVKPTRTYIQAGNTNDFTVVIDSIIRDKICISITDVQHITFNSNHEIDLGCMQFVLNNEPFNSIKSFDYLSFKIIDECNNNLQTIRAWLTEENKYWQTEDGHYWKLEE